jgi:hypothetical protein
MCGGRNEGHVPAFRTAPGPGAGAGEALFTFCLRLRGALCWAGACSKIEIAGGVEFEAYCSGSTAEPDGWRRAAPSALHLLSRLIADHFAAWPQCFELMQYPTTLLKCRTPISTCK